MKGWFTLQPEVVQLRIFSNAPVTIQLTALRRNGWAEFWCRGMFFFDKLPFVPMESSEGVLSLPKNNKKKKDPVNYQTFSKQKHMVLMCFYTKTLQNFDKEVFSAYLVCFKN